MTLPSRATLDRVSQAILDAAWIEPYGFSRPNPGKYPYQWLWDSCFHAISWSRLGSPRAVRELRTLFSLQQPNGFVPNMGYQSRPRNSTFMWRSRGRSDITQPPMYGHALRVLSDRGYDVSDLLEPARRALLYLFDNRLDPSSGLIRIVHPWESGADDSPRWDSWGHPRGFSRQRWNLIKFRMLLRTELRDGCAVHNPMFEVGSVSFNALVAFNARELAALTGDAVLKRRADDLAAAIERRWSDRLQTWVDLDLASGQPRVSSTVRTLDALLPVLVSGNRRHVDAAFAQITARRAFWDVHGPRSTSAEEPSFDSRQYWRGDSWPQLTYLLMVAADRGGRRAPARMLAEALVRGAHASGMAERWEPHTGEGLGAIPQSWTTIAGEAALYLERQLPPMGLAS